VPRRRARLLPAVAGRLLHAGAVPARAPAVLGRAEVPGRRRRHRAGGAGHDRTPPPGAGSGKGRPLELLFRRVAGVLLPSRDPWATVCGLLVVAWDGTTLKVPATPENTAAFGRPRGGGKKPVGGKKASSVEGHYPHLRVVALIACGTRALLGAAIGPSPRASRRSPPRSPPDCGPACGTSAAPVPPQAREGLEAGTGSTAAPSKGKSPARSTWPARRTIAAGKEWPPGHGADRYRAPTGDP
jgi:hypothetical protein